MDGAVDSRVVVGVDLHRRHTVLVAMDAQGRPVGGPVRVVNWCRHGFRHQFGACAGEEVCAFRA
jgi:Ethanolamine utilization protein EutJ (predicted chaperonin)